MRDERAMVIGAGELSPELRARLDRELEKGERVVWSAAPLPRAYAQGAWALCVFGVVFGGFAVFWMTMAGAAAWFGGAAAGSAGVNPAVATPFALFPLCGLPFLAVGVAMMTAPIWMRGRAAKVVYAVTDRRAIVISPQGFKGESVRSFSPTQLGSIERVERVERADGSGNLVFARELYGSTGGEGGSRVRDAVGGVYRGGGCEGCGAGGAWVGGVEGGSGGRWGE